MSYQSDQVIAGAVPDQTSPKGMVLSAVGKFTAPAGGVAVAGVIEMVKVPKNAVVHDVIVQCSAFGGTNTFSLGDGGAAARFLSAVSGVSAAIFSLASDSAVAGALGYKYSASDTIDVTIAASSMPAAATLTVTALYSVDA